METQQGIVTRAHSSLYTVLADDGSTMQCRARRRLRRPDTSWPEYPVPGDEVEWQLMGGAGSVQKGMIEAVRPRKSEISRTRFGSKHVVVANLARLVVVSSVREPAVDRGLIDRLLATSERNQVVPIVCLHKIDLAQPGELEPLRVVYRCAGYEVVCTSVKTMDGLQDLRELLRNHVAAFMGPSGAGKSHLLRTLQPGLEIRTGHVNTKTGQGRHTTTRVDLHPTDFGALIADTPGVREFGLWDLGPDELPNLFPEFRSLAENCRFGGCTHDHEPGCAVKEAVESQAIDVGRHRSYLAIREELLEKKSSSRPKRSSRSRRGGPS